MRVWHRHVLAGVAVVSLVGAAGITSTLAAQNTQSQPDDLSRRGLFAVDSVSPSDAWAVGRGGGKTGPLIEHWDGARWAEVPGPAIKGGYLQAVSDSGPDDVWAVGESGLVAGGRALPLTEHWDGTSWTRVSVDIQGDKSHWWRLSGVVALAPDDAWAVGEQTRQGDRTPARALSYHWDGSQWRPVPVADPGQGLSLGYQLAAVDAASDGDLWAVGSTGDHGLVSHWNGSGWDNTVIDLPTGVDREDLRSVSVGGSDDIWAVGAAADNERALTIHWDGTSWTHVDAHSPPQRAVLESVVTLAADDAFTVGYVQHNLAHKSKQLVEQWDGSAWSPAATKVTGDREQAFFGVDGTSSTDVWAVGYATILHWDGASWTQFPLG